MTDKQRQRLLQTLGFLLLVMVVGISFDPVADATTTTTANHWQLQQTSQAVQFSTPGSAGTDLTISYPLHACQHQGLQIALKATSPDVQDFVGQSIRVQIKLGKRQATILLPISRVNLLDTGQYQLLLSDFILGNQLTDDLGKYDQMHIDVLQPERLAAQLTTSLIQFDIRGFQEMHQLGQRHCMLSSQSGRTANNSIQSVFSKSVFLAGQGQT